MAAHIPFSELVRIEGSALGGSTGAYMVTYNGEPYVYKSGESIRHAINEYIAFKLYDAVGTRVPRTELVYEGAEPVGFILEFINGSTPAAIADRTPMQDKRLKQAIMKDYIVHALFANRDAKNYENYIVPLFPPGVTDTHVNFSVTDEEMNNYYNGLENAFVNDVAHVRPPNPYNFENVYVIDLGGALYYRAMGAEKGANFDRKKVKEIDSLAEFSEATEGKFFVAIQKSENLKRRTICERWTSIDKTSIPRLLQSEPIQSLLIKYDMIDLTRTLRMRMEAIDTYCAKDAQSDDELLALSEALYVDISGFSGNPVDLKHIVDTVSANPDVLAHFIRQPLLIQAYTEKKFTLFDHLLPNANKEALNVLDHHGHSLLYTVLLVRDYERAVKLIIGGAKMTLEDMARIDILQLIRRIDTLNPKFSIIGRLTVAQWEPIRFSDIIVKPANPYGIEMVPYNSLLDKQVLLPKPIRELQSWIASQIAYLASEPRIFSIVRAYTFRGDKLANSYLRGDLDKPYDILNIIRGDSVVPFAYQIYDNYDFLVKQGLTMPAKDTLMREDGVTIHNANIKELYLANFDYFLRLPNLHKLIKDYCRDLLHIIQRAPPAPDDMFVYRGIKDENHLVPGTLEYVNTSFQSTTLNPYTAANFAASYFDTPIKYCVYEMRLPFGAQCLYTGPASHFGNESEVLLPYNLRYAHSYDISVKYLRKILTPIDGDTDPAKLQRVFVRRINIHGFSGTMEPRLASVAKTKTRNKNKYRNVHVNRSHSKTVRKGKYGKTVNMNNF